VTHSKHLLGRALVVALGLVLTNIGIGAASSPGTDGRLTNDDPSLGGYVSNYTLNTGIAYTDPTLAECSRSRGRQNEPAVAVNPRDTSVLVGSSNDYCGVYNDGNDANGAPAPVGPIWLGYYRSENGGTSFQSSLVPGYPGDVSPYASRAAIRTAGAGDPVLAWDGDGRLFAGAESSDDPAGSKKTLGDVWVATYENPAGSAGATLNDGKEFKRSVIVARGSSAPNLLGKFQDKTAIEADRTGTTCGGNVYFANSRFVGNGGSNIYFYRSLDHGASFSHGTLITPNVNDVQDPEIAVTSNGHVYVTFDATLHKGNQLFDAAMYARSTDCGATFSTPKVLATMTGYTYQDLRLSGGRARDCGDFANACQSGYTFARNGSSARSAADQTAGAPETLYVTYEASIPGTEVPSGTTFGSAGPGTGSQGGVYFLTLNGATGAVSTPKQVDPIASGHQFFSDVSVEGGTIHVVWYDSRNDACYAPQRPIGNCAAGSATPLVPSIDVRGTRSSNAGATFDASTQVTDVTSNAAWEQFGGRTVPFNGDYIWLTSKGNFAYTAWTDYRNVVGGTDQREAGADDHDSFVADVMQCRETTASGLTGDKCPRAGGLDQNIYGDLAP
jgi:hypothetical protein